MTYLIYYIKAKTLNCNYVVYTLFLSEGLMCIDVHVLHIIMSKKLENYHDLSGYKHFNS